MDETPSKRSLQKEQTRQALLRAAEDLFAKEGFHATTVRAITDAAGVTERTFFRYFASKDELVSNDMEQWLESLERELQKYGHDLAPLIAIEQALLAALDEPGPIATWLYPTDASGKPGQKANGTSGVTGRLSTILMTWLPESEHARFRANVLARTSVSIVRVAISSASAAAAQRGEPAGMSEITKYIIEGFALVRETRG